MANNAFPPPVRVQRQYNGPVIAPLLWLTIVALDSDDVISWNCIRGNGHPDITIPFQLVQDRLVTRPTDQTAEECVTALVEEILNGHDHINDDVPQTVSTIMRRLIV